MLRMCSISSPPPMSGSTRSEHYRVQRVRLALQGIEGLQTAVGGHDFVTDACKRMRGQIDQGSFIVNKEHRRRAGSGPGLAARNASWAASIHRHAPGPYTP